MLPDRRHRRRLATKKREINKSIRNSSWPPPDAIGYLTAKVSNTFSLESLGDGRSSLVSLDGGDLHGGRGQRRQRGLFARGGMFSVVYVVVDLIVVVIRR